MIGAAYRAFRVERDGDRELLLLEALVDLVRLLLLVDRAEDDALDLVGRGHLGQEGQFLDTRAAPGSPEVEHDEARAAVVLEPGFNPHRAASGSPLAPAWRAVERRFPARRLCHEPHYRAGIIRPQW